jgi:hypothetical protein
MSFSQTLKKDIMNVIAHSVYVTKCQNFELISERLKLLGFNYPTAMLRLLWKNRINYETYEQIISDPQISITNHSFIPNRIVLCSSLIDLYNDNGLMSSNNALEVILDHQISTNGCKFNCKQNFNEIKSDLENECDREIDKYEHQPITFVESSEQITAQTDSINSNSVGASSSSSLFTPTASFTNSELELITDCFARESRHEPGYRDHTEALNLLFSQFREKKKEATKKSKGVILAQYYNIYYAKFKSPRAPSVPSKQFLSAVKQEIEPIKLVTPIGHCPLPDEELYLPQDFVVNNTINDRKATSFLSPDSIPSLGHIGTLQRPLIEIDNNHIFSTSEFSKSSSQAEISRKRTYNNCQDQDLYNAWKRK